MNYNRRDLRDELGEAMRKGTPRALRAVRFSDMILHIVRDFVPDNQDVYRIMCDEIQMLAFRDNLEVIHVPPEKDHLDKLQLERAMIEDHPMMILAKEKGPLRS